MTVLPSFSFPSSCLLTSPHRHRRKREAKKEHAPKQSLSETPLSGGNGPRRSGLVRPAAASSGGGDQRLSLGRHSFTQALGPTPVVEGKFSLPFPFPIPFLPLFHTHYCTTSIAVDERTLTKLLSVPNVSFAEVGSTPPSFNLLIPKSPVPVPVQSILSHYSCTSRPLPLEYCTVSRSARPWQPSRSPDRAVTFSVQS